MSSNFDQFVDALKVPATFAVWGPALALVEVGDFDALVAFGHRQGHSFSADDVKTYLDKKQSGVRVTPSADRADEPNAYLRAWLRHC